MRSINSPIFIRPLALSTSMTPNWVGVKLNSLKVSETFGIDGTKSLTHNYHTFTAMFLSKSLISSPFQIDAVFITLPQFF